MIFTIDPRIILVVAFVLLLAGFFLPVLMIMRYLPSTFLLNFIAYISSFLGLMLGILGAIAYAMRNRKKDM